MKYLKNIWKEYKFGKKALRIEREPELEFSFQYFQNDIPRIEFIRQKSLLNFKDIKIENPHDFAIKIFPLNDKKIIQRIEDWKYFENSFDLQDDENSPPYLCLYMKGNIKQIPAIANEILNSIFKLEVGDEIEYGINLYE